MVVTDGFWADLNQDEQARFLGGGDVALPDDADDRSVLVIRPRSEPHGSKERCIGESAGNLYVKTEATAPRR